MNYDFKLTSIFGLDDTPAFLTSLMETVIQMRSIRRFVEFERSLITVYRVHLQENCLRVVNIANTDLGEGWEEGGPFPERRVSQHRRLPAAPWEKSVYEQDGKVEARSRGLARPGPPRL
ncbi:unnamed protein product [Colias eurytheme]|nr:unnamed protein product [Colias eurytheme]